MTLIQLPDPAKAAEPKPEKKSDAAALMTLYQNYRSAVWIPLLQAFALALTVALFAMATYWLVEAPSKWSVGATVFAAVLMVGVGLGLWLWKVRSDQMLDAIEEAMGVDINRDGKIGDEDPEPPARQSVRLEIVTRNGSSQQTQFVDMPVSLEKLQRLAAGVLAGKPMSERAWTNGGGFTQGEFDAVRGELLRRGWIRWINEQFPTQGVELTAVGRHVFERLANSPTPEA